MNIFLVRHGESVESNERWQTPRSPLSNLGRRQAQVLPKLPRFQTIDLVLSSKWTRAQKTAQVVSKALNKPLELFEGIHERGQHPKLYGAKRSSKISQRYYKGAVDNYSNLDWKFEGLEESLREVAERAIKFKDHLVKKHLGQNLLIVSHDVFIRCFVTVCILGKGYKDDTFNRIFRALRLANAGISLLEYDEKRGVWKVWYLNDFSHLKYIRKIASKN